MLGQTSKVLYTKPKENVHINVCPEMSGFFIVIEKSHSFCGPG